MTTTSWKKYVVLIIFLLLVTFFGLLILRNYVPQVRGFTMWVGIEDTMSQTETGLINAIQGNPAAVVPIVTGSIGSSVYLLNSLRTKANEQKANLDSITSQFNDEKTKLADTIDGMKSDVNDIKAQYEDKILQAQKTLEANSKALASMTTVYNSQIQQLVEAKQKIAELEKEKAAINASI